MPVEIERSRPKGTENHLATRSALAAVEERVGHKQQMIELARYMTDIAAKPRGTQGGATDLNSHPEAFIVREDGEIRVKSLPDLQKQLAGLGAFNAHQTENGIRTLWQEPLAGIIQSMDDAPLPESSVFSLYGVSQPQLRKKARDGAVDFSFGTGMWQDADDGSGAAVVAQFAYHYDDGSVVTEEHIAFRPDQLSNTVHALPQTKEFSLPVQLLGVESIGNNNQKITAVVQGVDLDNPTSGYERPVVAEGPHMILAPYATDDQGELHVFRTIQRELAEQYWILQEGLLMLIH